MICKSSKWGVNYGRYNQNNGSISPEWGEIWGWEWGLGYLKQFQKQGGVAVG